MTAFNPTQTHSPGWYQERHYLKEEIRRLSDKGAPPDQIAAIQMDLDTLEHGRARYLNPVGLAPPWSGAEVIYGVHHYYVSSPGAEPLKVVEMVPEGCDDIWESGEASPEIAAEAEKYLGVDPYMVVAYLDKVYSLKELTKEARFKPLACSVEEMVPVKEKIDTRIVARTKSQTGETEFYYPGGEYGLGEREQYYESIRKLRGMAESAEEEESKEKETEEELKAMKAETEAALYQESPENNPRRPSFTGEELSARTANRWWNRHSQSERTSLLVGMWGGITGFKLLAPPTILAVQPYVALPAYLRLEMEKQIAKKGTRGLDILEGIGERELRKEPGMAYSMAEQKSREEWSRVLARPIPLREIPVIPIKPKANPDDEEEKMNEIDWLAFGKKEGAIEGMVRRYLGLKAPVATAKYIRTLREAGDQLVRDYAKEY